MSVYIGPYLRILNTVIQDCGTTKLMCSQPDCNTTNYVYPKSAKFCVFCGSALTSTHIPDLRTAPFDVHVLLRDNNMNVDMFANVNGNLVLPNDINDGGTWLYDRGIQITLNDKLVDYTAKFLKENWVALLSKIKEKNIKHECLVGCVVF